MSAARAPERERLLTIGAVCEIPNHSTDRKAQHTAGNVSRTMIHVSKNNSASRFNPISSPNAVPASIAIAKPSKMRRSVCATTR